MVGIIAYGSLINPQEIENRQEHPTHAIPVRLDDFKRSFNQHPAWRKNISKYSAVLNIESSEKNWLNAVCYCYAEFDFTILDTRERGYHRTLVPPSRINCYKDHNLPGLEEIFIYQGKREYNDTSLLPNPDYLDICMAGAKKWGESFYHDFLNTTHVNNGILLHEYLSSP